jgi:hypothetical protein
MRGTEVITGTVISATCRRGLSWDVDGENADRDHLENELDGLPPSDGKSASSSPPSGPRVTPLFAYIQTSLPPSKPYSCPPLPRDLPSSLAWAVMTEP